MFLRITHIGQTGTEPKHTGDNINALVDFIGHWTLIYSPKKLIMLTTFCNESTF